MQKLMQGIHSFQTEVFGTQRKLFERLAKGQEPIALFITCSDSRINPNLITQTQPGDLFIIRNAGNIIPPYAGSASSGEAATIEFAIANLGVKDVIVCGHSQCGAMKVIHHPERLTDMPAMKSWLVNAESTRRIMVEKYKDLSEPEFLTATVEENVLVQLENLRTHPTVSARIASGQLNLHGWVYKIETGEVFAFNPHEGQYFPLSKKPPTPAFPDIRLRAESVI
ncbi:MAG TPA: carbonic anhydrase [Phycisphaerae bacterium]|nr:carbonic anhydrase [Phycisphaerae bacterium]